MITFTGGIQSQMLGSETMASRNFFVYPYETLSEVGKSSEKHWGAGMLYADREIIRVQMVMPSQAFDYGLPEHGESTRSFIGLAASAAGVIVSALNLSETSYRREIPYGYEFGVAIPFDGVLLTERSDLPVEA